MLTRGHGQTVTAATAVIASLLPDTGCHFYLADADLLEVVTHQIQVTSSAWQQGGATISDCKPQSIALTDVTASLLPDNADDLYII